MSAAKREQPVSGAIDRQTAGTIVLERRSELSLGTTGVRSRLQLRYDTTLPCGYSLVVNLADPDPD
jgi:hypothetical protein